MAAAKAVRLNQLAKTINEWAKEKGFWDAPVATGDALQWITNHQKSTKLFLVVTELAELGECIRSTSEVPSKLEGFTNEEEELADAMIRLLDYAGNYNLRIGEALAAKMEHNLTRPHRHGKQF